MVKINVYLLKEEVDSVFRYKNTTSKTAFNKFSVFDDDVCLENDFISREKIGKLKKKQN